MNPKYLNYVGKKHGLLNILHIVDCKGEKPKYYCVCDCGNIKEFVIYNIARTHSCGCYRVQVGKNRKTHGQSGKSSVKTKAYSVWSNMKSRCTNPKTSQYSYYGGRGIKISEEWKSFENFYKDMGEVPVGMTLDRIDPNGNYEVSNCRWASLTEQARNKNNSMFLHLDGVKIHLTEASERFSIKKQTIWARIKLSGWTDRQAVGLDAKPPLKRKA